MTTTAPDPQAGPAAAPLPMRPLPRRSSGLAAPTASGPAGAARTGLWLWCGGLAATLWLLQVAGGRALPAPPLQAERWPGWLDQHGGAVAVVSLLRLLSLAGLWYLVALTVAGLLARWRRSPHQRTLDRLTPRALRGVLGGTNGLVTAAVLTASVVPLAVPRAGGANPGAEVAPLAVVPLRLAPAEAQPPQPPPAAPGGRVAVTPDGPFLPGLPFPAGHAASGGLAPRPDAAEPAPPEAPAAWVVEPGDHLWAIATQVVTEVHGHPVSDAVVADYWCELVEINRPRLVDPANPDLIYPGQELLVPAPPARS